MTVPIHRARIRHGENGWFPTGRITRLTLRGGAANGWLIRIGQVWHGLVRYP